MRIVVILAVCALFSCGNKKEVPKEVLPPKEMTNVLWDVMLADELANKQYGYDASPVKLDTNIVLYQQIMQTHNTTQGQFKKSLQFYQSRPDLLQVILDTLQKRAEKPVINPPVDSLKAQ
jgi:hypothetical protein